MNGLSTPTPMARPWLRFDLWRPYAAVAIAMALVVAVVSALRINGYPAAAAPWLLLPVLMGAALGGLWGGLFAVALGLIADAALFRELAFFRAAVSESGSGIAAAWFLAPALLACLAGHGFRLSAQKSQVMRAQQRMLEEENTRRRKLEESLSRSRQAMEAQRSELEDIYVSMPVALAVVDRNLRLVRISRRWSETSNQAPEALLGREVGDVIPLSGGVLASCLSRVLGTGEPIFDHELMGSAGSAVRWLGSFIPVKDDSGQISGVRIALQDVTAQHRSEAALRESEARFRALAEGLPYGIRMTDEAGATLFANRRWFELTGLSPEEIQGTGWMSVAHPLERDRLAREYQAALRNGSRLETEIRLRSGSGGDYRWHLLSLLPLGGRTTWLLVAVDIHQSKTADLALRNLGDRLLLSLEAGRMAAWMNPRPEAPAEWLDPLYLLASIPLESPLRNWIGAADGVAGLASEEFRALGSDGETRWVRAVARPLPGEDGLGVAGVLVDVTEARRTEEELSRSLSAMLETNRRKDEFLAVLTHELRNPLAPILTSAQLLRRRGLERPDLLESATSSIERQVKHLNRMIGDLSDISRIGRGKIELRPEILELEAVVSQAVETCRLMMDKHRQELFVDIPEQPLYVRSDPARLGQIIGNLLGNASKFTPAGGNIHLAVASDGAAAYISIRDEGIGIEPAELERIFEPFVQLERPLHGGHVGLGVGLAVAKGLLELQGGRITGRSEGKGRGSEFVIRLPLADADASGRSSAG